jgi:lysozyme
MFNLGRPRLSRFKKFIAAINEGDWEIAAIEMMDSKWAVQVGPRSERLRDRVLGLHTEGYNDVAAIGL